MKGRETENRRGARPWQGWRSSSRWPANGGDGSRGGGRGLEDLAEEDAGVLALADGGDRVGDGLRK